MENDRRSSFVVRHWIQNAVKQCLPKSFNIQHSTFIILMTMLVISGCGYKPVAQYGRDLLPDPVYVDVKLSGAEPQNGIYLKDEIIRTLKTQFHEKVTADRSGALSKIIVPTYTIKYSPLTYDLNGYVTRYRVTTSILFQLELPDRNVSKQIVSSEDVSIQSSSLTSSAARDAAIRVGIRKAMDQFIAWVAEKGIWK